MAVATVMSARVIQMPVVDLELEVRRQIANKFSDVLAEAFDAEMIVQRQVLWLLFLQHNEDQLGGLSPEELSTKFDEWYVSYETLAMGMLNL